MTEQEYLDKVRDPKVSDDEIYTLSLSILDEDEGIATGDDWDLFLLLEELQTHREKVCVRLVDMICKELGIPTEEEVDPTRKDRDIWDDEGGYVGPDSDKGDE